MQMRKLFYFLLERNRLLEVVLRNFITRFPNIKKFALKLFKSDQNKNSYTGYSPGLWSKYCDCLKSMAIQEGDIVLVHSSMKGLAPLGVNPNEIITFLRKLVGPTGTLVFPTYPLFKKKLGNGALPEYDPKKNLPWTGMLPRIFLHNEGVVRSAFPHNTLAAIGPHAKNMMERNLQGRYSQGIHSSWEYGVNHNMKILYLGVRACTSCTIVHYVEDILADRWPIKNWYDEKIYEVRTDQDIKNICSFERKKKWFDFYCMFNTGFWLKKNNYLEEYNIENVYAGFMPNVKDMTDEMIQLAQKGKLAYLIPKRYWRKK